MNILSEIELSDAQVKAFNEEMQNWKEKKTKEISEKVKSDSETEVKVKVRELEEEKTKIKAHYEKLVEEVTQKMQKVMVKRFTTAMKDMYDELKVEARKDVLNDPRVVALEEVKKVIYPLMDETVTKGYVDELTKALRVVEEKEVENEKLKAQIKLKEIVSSLSPTVAEAVSTFIGDPSSVEEVI
jgi:hypothetical protein